MIIVINDVLENQYLDYINYCLPKLQYEQHYSNAGSGISFFASFNDDVFGYGFLLDILINQFRYKEIIPNKKIQLDRCYTNLYPYKNSGDWHSDDDHPNAKTILFYPQAWEPDWEGGTSFSSNPTIEYKQNAAVLFNGNIPHKADYHTNPNHRYTIAYKIKI